MGGGVLNDDQVTLRAAMPWQGRGGSLWSMLGAVGAVLAVGGGLALINRYRKKSKGGGICGASGHDYSR